MTGVAFADVVRVDDDEEGAEDATAVAAFEPSEFVVCVSGEGEDDSTAVLSGLLTVAVL